MALEQEIRNRQDEQKVTVCPPTTFSDLLGFSGETDSTKRLAHANVHILKISQEQTTQYLALVDLKLRKHGLGKLLFYASPYKRNYSKLGYFEYGGQQDGILADWEMPDNQKSRVNSSEEYARLLRIHKEAFPVEWEEFELDRKILIQTLKGSEIIFPIISWVKDSRKVRRYDLSTVSPEMFTVLRNLLTRRSRVQSVLLTSSAPRTFNPNIGLVTVAYLQPELYGNWGHKEKLPLDQKTDYDGRTQLIGGAQVPLFVLWRKDQILAGKPFDKMEEYANS